VACLHLSGIRIIQLPVSIVSFLIDIYGEPISNSLRVAKMTSFVKVWSVVLCFMYRISYTVLPTMQKHCCTIKRWLLYDLFTKTLSIKISTHFCVFRTKSFCFIFSKHLKKIEKTFRFIFNKYLFFQIATQIREEASPNFSPPLLLKCSQEKYLTPVFVVAKTFFCFVIATIS
jgi:hypothetical protein